MRARWTLLVIVAVTLGACGEAPAPAAPQLHQSEGTAERREGAPAPVDGVPASPPRGLLRPASGAGTAAEPTDLSGPGADPSAAGFPDAGSSEPLVPLEPAPDDGPPPPPEAYSAATAPRCIPDPAAFHPQACTIVESRAGAVSWKQERDRDGHLLRDTHFAPDGGVWTDLAYRYAEGRLTDRVTYSAGVASHTSFSYDAAGLLIREVTDGVESTYRYDERGRLLERLTPAKDRFAWTLYDDASGRITRVEDRDQTDRVLAWRGYTYSPDGTRFTVAAFHKVLAGEGLYEDELSQAETFTYAPDGTLLQYELTPRDPLWGWFEERKYDLGGHLLSSSRWADEHGSSTQTEYDDNGNPTRSTSFSGGSRGAIVTERSFTNVPAGPVLVRQVSHREDFSAPPSGWTYGVERDTRTCAGTLLRAEEDQNSDGTVDVVRTYDYGCFDADLAEPSSATPTPESAR